MVNIGVKKEHKDIEIPAMSFSGDAGFDLRAKKDYIIYRGETKLIGTGLYFDIPFGYEIQVRARSGIALINSVIVTNGIGTIDSTYKGEVGVILTNLGERPFEIKAGDRIAQAVVCKLPSVKIVETETVGESERGSGGFGSTGIK